MLSVLNFFHNRNNLRNTGKSVNFSNLLKSGIFLIFLSFISACSVTSGVPEDALVTNSVAKPAKKLGVEDTDAEVIKKLVAVTDKVEKTTSELAWSNPDTGNSGTIVAIDKFVGSHGQKCKKFQTTVDNFMGISLYDGETCEVNPNLWVLSWFTRRNDG